MGDCDPRYTKKRKGDGTCQCHTGHAGGRCRECHPSHFGDKCENCHLGYHKVGSACIEGNCSSTGTKARKPNGICQCLPGFVGSSCEDCATGHTGPACGQCLPGYYLDGNNGCLEGFCAPYGTEAETGGACQCKVGFTGSLCDRCDPAYHRVDNYCHGTLFIIMLVLKTNSDFISFQRVLVIPTVQARCSPMVNVAVISTLKEVDV